MRRFIGALLFGLSLGGDLSLCAQEIKLKDWAAPPFWSAPSRAVPDGAGPVSKSAARSDREALVLPSTPLPYVAIVPCRQYDSRDFTPLVQNTPRAVLLNGAPCGIPATAQAASVNITVFNITGATGNGVFSVGVSSPPATAWINYPPTETQRANAGTVALTDPGGEIVVQVNQGGGSVDFVVDVNGYYAPPAAGTFFRSIPALICTAQGSALSGDLSTCSGGGTVRTDGDNNFPCEVRARATRDTYLCDLGLPSGAILREIIAYGDDSSSDGYLEAAVWRTANDTFAPTYLSSGFGGIWQSSGLLAAPGFTSFPIFQTTDTPHTVSGDSRYTIGFGFKAPTSVVFARGFLVRYEIP